MIMKRSLRTVLLASLCVLPRLALAQEVPANNEVWVGGKWQTEDSAKYGKYNGSPDNGASMVGGFKVDAGTPWDSPSGIYFKATGDNLDFNSQRLMPNSSGSVSFGQQGLWGADIWLNNTTYIQSLKFNTLYNSDGGLRNGAPFISGVGGVVGGGTGGIDMGKGQAVGGLPPGQAIGTGTAGIRQQPGDNGSTNAAISNLVQSELGQTEVGLVRTSAGVGLKFIPPVDTDWLFTTSAQEEHKDGTKENSLVVGGTSVNKTTGSDTYFAEPVNYDTGTYKAMLSYTKPRVQAQLSYTFSHFVDNNTSFNAMEPFKIGDNTTQNKNTLVTNFLSSAYSLPPSNDAHQFRVQLGYNITPTTRFAANLGYGLQYQNAAYAPETILTTGPVYAAGIGSSYNGKVQTFLGNATLTARPLPKLDLKASYTGNERDNDSTPLTVCSIDIDQYKAGGCGAVNGKPNSIQFTNPYSFLTQTGKLEAGYRILPSTKVTLGDSYNVTERKYSAVDRSHENTVSGQIRSQLTSQVTASLRDSYGMRRETTPYSGNAPWLALGETQAGSPDQLGMQHYSEDDRNRNEVRGDVSYSPRDNLSLDLNGKYYEDTYPQALYGLTKDHVITVDPDVGFAVNDKVNTHLFYAYEKAYYLLDSTSGNQSGTAPSVPFYWNRGESSVAHTVGANADWQATSKLKFNLGYTFQLGTIGYGMDGSGLCPTVGSCGGATAPWNYTIVQIPDSRSTLNSANISGEYKLTEAATISLGYGIERYHSNDYLYTQAATSPLYANMVLPGDGSPNYTVQTVGVGIHMKW